MGSEADSLDFRKILENYPKTSQRIKNYCARREWKKAHYRHGSKLGFSEDDTRDFGVWLLNQKDLDLVEEVRPRKAPENKVLIENNDDDTVTVSSRGERVKTLSALLDVSNVDLNKWRVTNYKVNTWEVASGNKSTGVEIIPIWQVKANLEPKVFSDVSAVKPIQILKRTPKPPRKDKLKRAIFVPDSQHGFIWKDRYRKLEPLHDRKAIDAVLQFTHHFQPDVIVLLGDMADFAQWSIRFPRQPALRQTTQPTINELYWQLAQFRSACPSARIVYTAGNHEERLNKYQVQNFDEGIGLTYANDKSEDPIFHMKRLLALDDLDIEYIGPYNRDWWLWDRIRVHHGSIARNKGGATVTVRVADGDWSEVFGHIHRVELAQRRVRSPNGPKMITAMSPGCLCRVDGAVPGVTKTPDWHHGVGLAYYDEETKIEHMHVLQIFDGRLIFNGQIFEGEDRRDEIAEATGFSQIDY